MTNYFAKGWSVDDALGLPVGAGRNQGGGRDR